MANSNPYTQYGNEVLHGRKVGNVVTWLTAQVTITGHQCGNCGAVVGRGEMKQHEAFHQTFSNRKADTMSHVLWCDPGEHAFKRGAPGSINFQGSEINNEGVTESTDIDACSIHNPFNRVRDNVKIEKELLAAHPTMPMYEHPDERD